MTVEHDRALADIEALRSLQPNWDSYGAVAIRPEAIAKALDMKQGLSGPWAVVPCSDGGIQLEQHAGGFDIEIVIRAYPTISPQGDDHG
jgi:hypothetical protein